VLYCTTVPVFVCCSFRTSSVRLDLDCTVLRAGGTKTANYSNWHRGHCTTAAGQQHQRKSGSAGTVVPTTVVKISNKSAVPREKRHKHDTQDTKVTTNKTLFYLSTRTRSTVPLYLLSLSLTVSLLKNVGTGTVCIPSFSSHSLLNDHFQPTNSLNFSSSQPTISILDMPPVSSSWQLRQEEAKTSFHNGNFSKALSSYQEAFILLTTRTSSSEETESLHQQERQIRQQQRSILLSNMVACRLKLGATTENLSAALEEAQECVLLNDKWPKGYVRLAAVYIALGNHSNDACQSLQTALRLDPSNSFARSMLLGELRRNSGAPPSSREHDLGQQQQQHREERDGGGTSSSSSGGTNLAASTTCCDYNEYTDVDDVCYECLNDSGSGSSNDNDNDNRTSNYTNSISRIRNVFSISWVYRFVSWYDSCTQNTKQVLHLLALLNILYISFGGRFGFNYIMGHMKSLTSSSSTASPHLVGNYGQDNAYERFYKEKSGYSSLYNSNVAKGNGFPNDYHRQRNHHEEYHHHHYQYNYGSDFYSIFLFLMILTFTLLLTQMQRQIMLRGDIPAGVPPGMGFGFGRRGRWMGRRGGVGHLYIGGFHIPLNLGRINRFRRPTR
jgi:Cytochrome c biogenesis factor